jgi:ATP-binding cassette subfamily C protein
MTTVGGEAVVGDVAVVPGNTSLPLNTPGTVLVVEAGAVAVFAVRATPGVGAGARRELFTVGAGDALFQTSMGADGIALHAVTLEETRVVTLPSHRVGERWSAADPAVRSLVTAWIERFGVPSPGFDAFPALQDALDAFHRDVLAALDTADRRDDAARADSLRLREDMMRQASAAALRDLAHATRASRREAGITGGPPLLTVVRTVARASSIDVVTPRALDTTAGVDEQLRAISSSSQFRMRRVTLDGEWWRRDSGPLLAFRVDDGAPVAVLPGATKGPALVDPDGGTVPLNHATASSLRTAAYMFYRPFPRRIDRPREIVAFNLRGRQRELLWLAGATICGMLLMMFVPVATSVLVDAAIPDANRSLFLQVALALVAVTCGKALFDLAEAFAASRLTAVANSEVQAAVWDRLLRLRPAFLRQYSTGDLASRAMAVSTMFRRMSSTGLQVVFGALASLLNVALMFYYSATLAWAGLAAGLVLAVATQFSAVALARRLSPLHALEGRLFGLSVQLIGGISKLRVSGSERFAFAYWARHYSEQQRLTHAVQRLEDHVGAMNQVLPTVATAAIFLLAGRALIEGDSGGLSAGSYLAFSAAFGTFIGSLSYLSVTTSQVLSDLNLWQRTRPILTAEPEIDSAKAHPGRLAGAVALTHVTFRYGDAGRMTLDDVTLHADAGEFVALVGPSGSGKSTVLRLLLGFEVPRSGAVTYDGQDLSGLDVLAVRRQLGVVMQTSNLLSGSIFENIAAGAAITLDQAWEAAAQAGFAEDIRACPMGMHTFVSEGAGNISMGQRQRLLIARALVFKPRILLFDEATSALDNRAQAVVSRSLDALSVTRIVIAHRLSTIRHAHRIFVMAHGRVVQQGRFEELASQEGLFARMMARQML